MTDHRVGTTRPRTLASSHPAPPNHRLRVIALLAAYNEADIIGLVVRHLINQGVDVYFLDNGSTDGTVAEVEPFVGRGVIKIEHFGEVQTRSGDVQPFQWEAILRRKEKLANELQADWFIHHDADEFRESPWRDRTLVEAIEAVDRAGYNAIDFAVLNFWPTHDGFKPGDDVRESFVHFERGKQFDRLQVKCWKRSDGPVDIVSTGGHDASFPDRRVFPIRFLLRHYPIRSQKHGERKVFQERRARFDPAERARGWHVQYDDITDTHEFLRDAGELTRFDPDAVRLDLMLEHRTVETLRADVTARAIDQEVWVAERDSLQNTLSTLGAEAATVRGKLDAEWAEAAAQREAAEKLRVELSHVEAARSLAAATAQRVQAEVTEMRRALVDEREALARAEANAARLQGDRERELSELRQTLIDTQQAHAKVEADATRLHGDLEKQLTTLRQSFRQTQEQHARVAADATRLRTEFDAHRFATDEMAREHRSQMTALTTERAALQAQLNATDRQLQSATSELTGLRSSRSWRLTRPLRWIYDRLRQLGRLPPT
ncbi:MAG: glycosyltransferase family 2 protein [Gemmatimonadales bacterium]